MMRYLNQIHFTDTIKMVSTLDFYKVNSYSWGAAFLASLYCGIENIKKNVDGNCWPLLVRQYDTTSFCISIIIAGLFLYLNYKLLLDEHMRQEHLPFVTSLAPVIYMFLVAHHRPLSHLRQFMGLEKFVDKQVPWNAKEIKLRINKGKLEQKLEEKYSKFIELWNERKPVEAYIKSVFNFDVEPSEDTEPSKDTEPSEDSSPNNNDIINNPIITGDTEHPHGASTVSDEEEMHTNDENPSPANSPSQVNRSSTDSEQFRFSPVNSTPQVNRSSSQLNVEGELNMEGETGENNATPKRISLTHYPTTPYTPVNRSSPVITPKNNQSVYPSPTTPYTPLSQMSSEPYHGKKHLNDILEIIRNNGPIKNYTLT